MKSRSHRGQTMGIGGSPGHRGQRMTEDDLIDTFGKEQVIRASGLLSLLMPQATGVGIGVKGLDGRYQLVNQAMRTLFARSAEEIIGLTDADLFPAAAAAQLKRSDRQIVDGAVAASDELAFSINGRALHCRWLKFPVLGADGKIISIGTVMLDNAQDDAVAELRLSLEQLQQTNQDLQRTLVELDRLASSDELTGAWNRRRLEEAVINEMDRLKRYNHPLSLAVLDIDLFKQVNDHHGHAAGDQVLVQLAGVIRATLRTTNSLTRWGGEEFVVLCPNTTQSTMSLLAERLREKIAGTVSIAGQAVTVSFRRGGMFAGRNLGSMVRACRRGALSRQARGSQQVPGRAGNAATGGARRKCRGAFPATQLAHDL